LVGELNPPVNRQTAIDESSINMSIEFVFVVLSFYRILFA